MSEVKVTLTLIDHLTAAAQKTLKGFKGQLDFAKTSAQGMMTAIDARAFSGVFKSADKAIQIFGRLGVKLNELAPAARKFQATFGPQEQLNIERAAESFNRMGAAWDRFVGHVLASSPQLNAAFDDITRRLDQVTKGPQLTESGKADERLRKAMDQLNNIPESQRDNPNVYYKPMVDAIKRSIAEAQADIAKAQSTFAAKSAQVKERKADLAAGIDLSDPFADIRELAKISSAQMDDILERDLANAMEFGSDLGKVYGDAFSEIDEDAMDMAFKMEQLRQQDLDDAAKALEEKTRIANEATVKMLKDQADAWAMMRDAELSEWMVYYDTLDKIQQEWQDSINETASFFTDHFMSAFDAIVSGTESAGRAFTRMIGGMIADIGRMMVQEQVMGFFKMLVGSISGGVGGDWQTELHNLYGTSPDDGVARASGGGVRAGVPHMVGERGPELFVPHTSGNVVTSGRSGGGGGIGSVTINVNGAQDPGRTAREIKAALSSLMANDPSARQMMRRAIA